MRDPNRIPIFISELGDVWKEKLPEWRFGQLMYNFMCEVGDPFYWEEDKFLEKFKEFVNKYS